MSVSTTVILPAQPAQGETVYTPLGGDGRSAPLGCYFCRAEIEGDAGSGTAAITIELDRRYTNLITYLNFQINVDAAAGDFMMRVMRDPSGTQPDRAQIVGTIPQVPTTLTQDNAAFLWYPPPVFFQGAGAGVASTLNVAATETYMLTAEVLVFDVDIRRLAPLPWLMLNVPGVSAPASI